MKAVALPGSTGTRSAEEMRKSSFPRTLALILMITFFPQIATWLPRSAH